MRKAGWYVIQVQTGQEPSACRAIGRACAGVTIGGAPLLEECFSPSFVHRMRHEGAWRDVRRLLLPGYVVAVTADPNGLQRTLRRLPEFTRLLTMGETFVPLRDDERAWIEEWTTRGDRTIPISIAHRKGGRVVVQSGPLKGREGMITRVIRKRCLAQVELWVNGKRVTTEVGLAVVPEADISHT